MSCFVIKDVHGLREARIGLVKVACLQRQSRSYERQSRSSATIAKLQRRAHAATVIAASERCQLPSRPTDTSGRPGALGSTVDDAALAAAAVRAREAFAPPCREPGPRAGDAAESCYQQCVRGPSTAVRGSDAGTGQVWLLLHTRTVAALTPVLRAECLARTPHAARLLAPRDADDCSA